MKGVGMLLIGISVMMLLIGGKDPTIAESLRVIAAHAAGLKP